MTLIALICHMITMLAIYYILHNKIHLYALEILYKLFGILFYFAKQTTSRIFSFTPTIVYFSLAQLSSSFFNVLMLRYNEYNFFWLDQETRLTLSAVFVIKIIWNYIISIKHSITTHLTITEITFNRIIWIYIHNRKTIHNLHRLWMITVDVEYVSSNRYL